MKFKISSKKKMREISADLKKKKKKKPKESLFKLLVNEIFI
jgi:hypothetical protein